MCRRPRKDLDKLTDRNGQATTLTHDGLDRTTLVTYADGSTVESAYDAGNRRTRIVDSLAGTILRTYDGLDRLATETTSDSVMSYTYDAAGRRTSLAVNGQPTTAYTYDAANQLDIDDQ
jgi:YD repeat-containing protein